MDFDRWLQRFVTKAEKVLFRLTLALVVFLFIIQAVLLNDNWRSLLSKTEQLEGKPALEDFQDVLAKKIVNGQQGGVTVLPQEKMALVLELSSPPSQEVELFLLINNKVTAQFGDEHLYIPVAPGDLLEVIGTVAGNSPAIINIVEVSGEITAPEVGHKIATFGERELLAWIIPKN